MKKFAACLFGLVVAASSISAEGIPGRITFENKLSSVVVEQRKNLWNDISREYYTNTTFGGFNNTFTVSIENELVDAKLYYQASLTNNHEVNPSRAALVHSGKPYNYGYLSCAAGYNYIEFKPGELVHLSSKAYKTAGAYMPVYDYYLDAGIIDDAVIAVDVFPVSGLMLSAGFGSGAILYNDGYDNWTHTDGKKYAEVMPNIIAGFEWTGTENVTVAGTINNILHPKDWYTDASGEKKEFNTSLVGLFVSYDAASLTGLDLVVGGGYSAYLNDFQRITGFSTGKVILATAQFEQDAFTAAFEGQFAVGDKATSITAGTNSPKNDLAAHVGYQITEQFQPALTAGLTTYDASGIRAVSVEPMVTFTPNSQDSILVSVSVLKLFHDDENEQKNALQIIRVPVVWKHSF